MKKILILISLCVACNIVNAQTNLFPTIDSLKNYVYRYVRNSTVESFTNYRLQNSIIGTIQMLDSITSSLSSGGVDTIYTSSSATKDTIKYTKSGTTYTAAILDKASLKLSITDTSAMLSPYLRSSTAAATYVPYTGATGSVNLGLWGLTTDRLVFNQSPTLAGGVGTIRWNDTDGTLEFGMKGGNVTQQIGQELPVLMRNSTGSTITNGQVVYMSGSTGTNTIVALAKADAATTSRATIGIATEDIPNGQTGFITTYGKVRDLNTIGLTEGALVYLSSTVAGGLTSTPPTGDTYPVVVGICERTHAVNGVIFVHVDREFVRRYEIDTALAGKQGALTLTTTGTSGASTLVGNTLNIPQYSGGGSTVTNFGLDSTGENFYGTLYDSTTWTTLGAFTNNGGTFTVTSNKIVGSSGAGTFTQSLDLNYYTMLERWKVSAKVKAATGVNGFGLGIRSAETGVKVSFVGRFDATSGNVIINAGGSNTQVAISSSALSFSTDDYIVLTVERNKDLVTVSARNATTNSATISASYTFLTYDATVQLPNTGKFAVFSFGGAFTVDSLAITSKEVKNAMILTAGDSKTQAYYASTWAGRWAEQLNTKFATTVVSAGGYDQTYDVINRLPEIYALAPKQIILAIGSNDVRAGTTASTIYANYDTIVARLERNLPGSVVYHALPFYESGGLDQTGLKAHIEATYSASRIFYTYDILRQPSTLNGDGVHPNDLGNTYIYNAIVEKMALVGGNNLLSGGTSTNLATASIPFSNGSVFVEDNANFRYNSASVLFGVGGTPTARGHIFTTADAAPATLTAFTNKHFVVGPSGSGLAISYSTAAGRSYLSSVSPGAAWRSFGLQGNDINFYYQGGSTPSWSVDGNGQHSSIGSQTTPLRNTFINTSTGAATYTEIAVGQSTTSTDQLRIVTLSSGYTTSNNYVQDGASIEAGSTLSGGLSVASTNASGVIRFYSGGTTERARFDATGALSIGSAASANTSSILDLTSTTKGLLLPRMTKAQRDAIGSPVEGLMIYQTDNTPGLRVYNGTNWMRFTETVD